MTWDEIAQLHKDGFEIGNHTRDHLVSMTKMSKSLQSNWTGSTNAAKRMESPSQSALLGQETHYPRRTTSWGMKESCSRDDVVEHPSTPMTMAAALLMNQTWIILFFCLRLVMRDLIGN